MAHGEKLEYTATSDALGHDPGIRVDSPNDAPEIYTDSRGNTHRLEVRSPALAAWDTVVISPIGLLTFETALHQPRSRSELWHPCPGIVGVVCC